MDVNWISLAKAGENFEATKSDARILYEGTHPEYGDVELEITHNYDGITYSLRDADASVELQSGWMTIPDLLGITGALQTEGAPQVDEDESYSVTVQWGTRASRKEMYDDDDEGNTYTFDTEAEKEAFVRAIGASRGWAEHRRTDI